jgi:hypothetical protein
LNGTNSRRLGCGLTNVRASAFNIAALKEKQLLEIAT